ncbi:hypothetical protein I552_2515 [Mycobacterium xenopi 3993]|nr:hypothetical protein I552_2515 [Mycobacterium xenopi 3993]
MGAAASMDGVDCAWDQQAATEPSAGIEARDVVFIDTEELDGTTMLAPPGPLGLNVHILTTARRASTDPAVVMSRGWALAAGVR